MPRKSPHKVKEYSCPSASPDGRDVKLLGVVLASADEPQVSYVSQSVGVLVEDALRQVDAGVLPTRILRLSAKCERGACAQFDGHGCRLGRNIAEKVAPVESSLPACNIRRTCRWYAENGPAVCLRCSRVVTTVLSSDDIFVPIIDMSTMPHTSSSKETFSKDQDEI